MNQTVPFGPRDSAERPNGDAGFVGVNMRLDPAQLPEGYASLAVNMRFREGVPETRAGSIVAPWLNNIDTVTGTVSPWETIYRAGVFRDPTTAREYVILAANGAYYACQPHNPPRAIPAPAAYPLSETTRFVQAFDKLIALRGSGNPTFSLSNLVSGFALPEPSVAGTGTLTIPDSQIAVHGANRLFVADEDSLLASDLLDYTHYSLLDNFRINQGTADRLVQVAMFGPRTIVAFKGRSVYRIENVVGDLSSASLDSVTTRFGCVAADSVVDCGSDMLWLSQHGVASLTLTERNEVQSAQGALAGRYRMLSEDIQPLIDRINWKYAAGATAALWNDRYYLAVPLDSAEMFGPELSGGGAVYDSGEEYVVGNLVPGATYRWIKGAEQTIGSYQLANGSEHLDHSTDFVAEGTEVSLFGTGTVTASVRRVYKGVNTVTLVYDLQNSAWCGYDEAPGLAVRQFFKANYLDRERLFAITHEGFIRMMEEGSTDRRTVPYVDVDVIAGPLSGAGLLRVNGGTNITASALDSVNTPPLTLGASSRSTAIQNLWVDVAAVGGFYPGASTVWSAPDTLAVKTTTGVRFYATNGVLPSVEYDSEAFSVRDSVEEPIQSLLVTRGYSAPDLSRSKFTGVTVDVQTWSPTFSIDLLADGVNEAESIVSGQTRLRSAYSKVDLGQYDETNAAGGFFNPFREDYSIAPTDRSFQFTPGDDIYGHLHQETREEGSANTIGRSCRIKVTNSTGRIRIMQTMVAMIPHPPAGGSNY